jgi:hypothetical protein
MVRIAPDKGTRMTTTQHDPLLTTEEAAQELKVSESFLAKERMKGTGPTYVKLGRAVRYRRSGLRPGSQPGPASPPPSPSTPCRRPRVGHRLPCAIRASKREQRSINVHLYTSGYINYSAD